MQARQGIEEGAYTFQSLPANTEMLRRSNRSDSALLFRLRTWRSPARAAKELRMIDDPDELRLAQARPVNSGLAHTERSQIHVHCSIRDFLPLPGQFASDKYLRLVDSGGAPRSGDRRFYQIRRWRNLVRRQTPGPR